MDFTALCSYWHDETDEMDFTVNRLSETQTNLAVVMYNQVI